MSGAAGWVVACGEAPLTSLTSTARDNAGRWKGADRVTFLEYLTVADLRSLIPTKATLSVICNKDGGILGARGSEYFRLRLRCPYF